MISLRALSTLGKFQKAGPAAWRELLSNAERQDYIDLQETLNAAVTSDKMNHLKATPTAGFNPVSGIRGYLPKDLWIALSLRDNERFLGMPQVYCILSSRGIEYGFAFSIHPSQFSSQPVKIRLKKILPSLFSTLPNPESHLVAELDRKIIKDEVWSFSDRSRYWDKPDKYSDLKSLLSTLRVSEENNVISAAVCRRIEISSLQDDFDLSAALLHTVELFDPMLEYISGNFPIASEFLTESETRNAKLENTDLAEAERVLVSTKKRTMQHAFRADLFSAYKACCITGNRTPAALQAAHIIDFTGDASNTVSNGLLLRADLHSLFDRGLISIDPQTFTIKVHESVEDQEYKTLNGQKIRLPRDKHNWPNAAALEWKWDKKYLT